MPACHPVLPQWRLREGEQGGEASNHHGTLLPATSALPADVIRLAGVLQIQAVGLLPLLVGAHRHNGLPSPLSAGDVSAGAEEHPIAVLGWDLVKELPQGLVALAAVAHLVGHAGGARRDVRRPVLLASVIEVAGLGCVQAVVHFGDVLHCKAEKTGLSSELGPRLLTAALLALSPCYVPGHPGCSRTQ